MNITRYTDYSLRVLIYLAVCERETVTIKEVADRYDISKNHLMKIVQALNIQGCIVATRGKNGGIKLGRPPAEINIGEIVRAMEAGSPLVECFGPDNHCVITPACKLKRVFAQAMQQFYQHLDHYSLADLVSGDAEDKLLRLLTVS